MSDAMNDQRGLRLLSLDNGGIKGLSSLLIIGEIMTRIKGEIQRRNGSVDQDLPTPKPCDYFDMISGTGTGAISAILLGRLRMSIEDAIKAYIVLMEDVFSDPKTMNKTTPEFKATKLEMGLKKIIKDKLGNENAGMMENYRGDVQGKCQVVVYAMSAFNINATLPVSFRSYPTPTGKMTKCTIWEVLRATTTHADMFKLIEVDVEGLGVKEQFVHGGLGCYNSTRHLFDEARQIYPGRAVASILSIGTGHPRTIQVAQGESNKVLKASLELAEGSEVVAEQAARQFGAGDTYCRLNVQQGMQEVGASEWGLMGAVLRHTRVYVESAEISFKLDTLVANLQARRVTDPNLETSGAMEIYRVPAPEPTPIAHPRSEVPQRRLTLTPRDNYESGSPNVTPANGWARIRGLKFKHLLSKRTRKVKPSTPQSDTH